MPLHAVRIDDLVAINNGNLEISRLHVIMHPVEEVEPDMVEKYAWDRITRARRSHHPPSRPGALTA